MFFLIIQYETFFFLSFLSLVINEREKTTKYHIPFDRIRLCRYRLHCLLGHIIRRNHRKKSTYQPTGMSFVREYFSLWAERVVIVIKKKNNLTNEGEPMRCDGCVCLCFFSLTVGFLITMKLPFFLLLRKKSFQFFLLLLFNNSILCLLLCKNWRQWWWWRRKE